MKCIICETDESVMRHHVIPKSRSEVRRISTQTEDLKIGCCWDCGNQIHQLFNNKELAKSSLEEILNTEQMKQYIVWKKKHPGNHGLRMSNKVKEWRKGHRG